MREINNLYRIKLNYREACRRAKELEEAADSLENSLKKDLSESMDVLGAAWVSENAVMYLTKEVELYNAIKADIVELRNIAVLIRQTAEAVKRADTEAWEIAEKRSS